ncbi:MAG: pyruvate formate-lyase-activating protein [Cyanobacteria bacterium P01_D01_bin.6]
MTTGRIHSIETCGTVDGPGLRFVIFTQGCPLHCLYCHNADCQQPDGGHEVTVDELIQEIQRYRSYLRQGGVTITGGEPLMQPKFVAEVLRSCQSIGLHTALDTSGYTSIAAAQPVLKHADLVLLDIKSYDPKLYRYLTQVELEPTLNFAQYLADIHKPMWVRFVLVPGLTDAVDNVEGLAKFVATLGNVERVEVLPFHQMGAYKWAQIGRDYVLKDALPPSPELIEDTVARFTAQGLTAVGN